MLEDKTESRNPALAAEVSLKLMLAQTPLVLSNVVREHNLKEKDAALWNELSERDQSAVEIALNDAMRFFRDDTRRIASPNPAWSEEGAFLVRLSDGSAIAVHYEPKYLHSKRFAYYGMKLSATGFRNQFVTDAEAAPFTDPAAFAAEVIAASTGLEATPEVMERVPVVERVEQPSAPIKSTAHAVQIGMFG